MAVVDSVSRELIAIDLGARPVAERVRVDFLTPTELKHADGIADRPEFPILFSRVRDRVATLGGIECDFAAMAERASSVELTSFESQHISRMRRSIRTGQTHPIGGFVGTAVYSGPLGEFLPWLEAARWTGVGRQAVWGKGEISLTLF